MASGDIFTAFLDFDKAQAKVAITAPTGFITDGSSKHRHLWSRLFSGDAVNVKRLQAGKHIAYFTNLSPRDSFEEYNTGGIAAPNNTQHLVEGTAYWRRDRWHKMYAKDEISYNAQTALSQMFVDVWAQKKALLEQDINDSLENQLFATPNSTLMEGIGTDTISPYSIPAHINQDTSGLWGSGWAPAGVFTTKQGITPGTASYGDNAKVQTRTYSTITANATTNAISAFHNMSKDIFWEKPTSMAEYWENDSLNKQMIVTDRPGHTNYQFLLQGFGGGDMFLGGKQDPAVPDPQYYGVPLMWNDTFGAALLYEPGSGAVPVAQTGAGVTGPRYLFINGNYLCPVVKADEFFNQDEPLRDSNRPDTAVIYTTLHYNLVCTSWKRQGIVYPTSSV